MATSSDGKEKEKTLNNKSTIWVGNLDRRLSEYNLLKILQRFGEIKNFDLHFHKSGAREGEPSYCFVEFKTFQGKKEKDKVVATTPGSSQSLLDSCDSKIQAIEAKLKLMESGHEKEPSGQGKHPLLVQSEQVRSHPYKKQERHHRGRGRRAR